jgi:hypothetical protein
MTAPTPIPLGPSDHPLIWCTTCGVHLALASQPLCPVCVDERKRAAS